MSSSIKRVKPWLSDYPPAPEDTRYRDALVAFLRWISRHQVLMLGVLSAGVVIGLSATTFAQDDVTLESLAEQVALIH